MLYGSANRSKVIMEFCSLLHFIITVIKRGHHGMNLKKPRHTSMYQQIDW